VFPVAGQAYWSELLISVISVTQRSWADCLLTMVVPKPTQPFILPGLVNEDQLQLGRQRHVWFIPFADNTWVAGKTVWSLENVGHT